MRGMLSYIKRSFSVKTTNTGFQCFSLSPGTWKKGTFQWNETKLPWCKAWQHEHLEPWTRQWVFLLRHFDISNMNSQPDAAEMGVKPNEICCSRWQHHSKPPCSLHSIKAVIEEHWDWLLFSCGMHQRTLNVYLQGTPFMCSCQWVLDTTDIVSGFKTTKNYMIIII